MNRWIRVQHSGTTVARFPVLLAVLAIVPLALHESLASLARSTLSGGEIRRVSLARLFVGRYQVLILDEPTEHLDTLTAAALMDDIWATADGLPILAITHDPEVVARCDREVGLGSYAAPPLAETHR